MMKHKVSDLESGDLDAAVAKAEGRLYDMHRMPRGADFVTVVDPEQSGWVIWSPSRDWSDGGPIIERERIDLEHGSDGCRASLQVACEFAYSDLVAAMRAYVASKFGEEVELP